MNRACEILIIGASKDGIAAYNYLKKNSSSKLLFVSNTFSFTPENDDYIESKVVLLNYKHGLIIASLNNLDVIVCKTVILATGDKIKEIKADWNSKVKYNYEPTKAKQVVFFGNNNQIAEWAIEAAKMNEIVTICLGTISAKWTKTLQKKIDKLENIRIFPNSKIINIASNKVELDTYTILESDVVFASIGREPEPNTIAGNLFTVDKNNVIITNDLGQTELVKEIYAIGACAGKSSKASLQIIKNIV